MFLHSGLGPVHYHVSQTVKVKPVQNEPLLRKRILTIICTSTVLKIVGRALEQEHKEEKEKRERNRQSLTGLIKCRIRHAQLTIIEESLKVWRRAVFHQHALGPLGVHGHFGGLGAH